MAVCTQICIFSLYNTGINIKNIFLEKRTLKHVIRIVCAHVLELEVEVEVEGGHKHTHTRIKIFFFKGLKNILISLLVRDTRTVQFSVSTLAWWEGRGTARHRLSRLTG